MLAAAQMGAETPEGDGFEAPPGARPGGGGRLNAFSGEISGFKGSSAVEMSPLRLQTWAESSQGQASRSHHCGGNQLLEAPPPALTNDLASDGEL